MLLSEGDRALMNAEIVNRIDQFMVNLDVDALVAMAVRDAIEQFVVTGAWRPRSFTSPIIGASGDDLVARPANDSILRRSVRIPTVLHDQVKAAADRLGCTQGVIIRAALVGDGLAAEMSKKLPALDPDEPGSARRRALLNLG